VATWRGRGPSSPGRSGGPDTPSRRPRKTSRMGMVGRALAVILPRHKWSASPTSSFRDLAPADDAPSTLERLPTRACRPCRAVLPVRFISVLLVGRPQHDIHYRLTALSNSEETDATVSQNADCAADDFGFMGLEPTGKPFRPLVLLYTVRDGQIVQERRLYASRGCCCRSAPSRRSPHDARRAAHCRRR